MDSTWSTENAIVFEQEWYVEFRSFALGNLFVRSGSVPTNPACRRRQTRWKRLQNGSAGRMSTWNIRHHEKGRIWTKMDGIIFHVCLGLVWKIFYTNIVHLVSVTELRMPRADLLVVWTRSSILLPHPWIIKFKKHSDCRN